MGATFSRVKNWTSEVLTYADLNAEIDNILNNLGPAGVDDYSTNATQMRITTDPGEAGTESLATALSGELERLRFAIKEIKGSGVSQWYSSSSTSLTELASAIGGGLISNRISSGRASTLSSQPLFLVPHGTNRTVSLQCSTSSFTYVVNNTSYTLTANVTSGTLTAAPSSNHTCSVNDATLAGQTFTKQLGEYDTVIPIDNIGTEVSSLIGKWAAFKAGSEYFIAQVQTASLVKAMRGCFFSSADASFARSALTDNDVLNLMKLTWVFMNTGGTIAVTYSNPRVSADQPSSPAVGDYWFDLVNNVWKSYDSSSYVTANATLVGIAIQDTSATIGARSFDFFKNHSSINTVKLEKISSTVVKGRDYSQTVVVYGSTTRYANDLPVWDITADLASGVTEAASTTYYLYIKESGDTVIDNKPPYDRGNDLFGLYHPYEAWRCVGEFYNNAASDISGVIGYADYAPLNAYSVIPSVSGHALTVTLANVNGDPITPQLPVRVEFSDIADNSKRAIADIRYPRAVTVPPDGNLGHASTKAGYIFAYLLATGNKDPNTDIGVCSSLLNHGIDQNATAVTTGSDLGNILYTPISYTSKPVNLVSRMLSTQTNAGTWDSVPINVTLDRHTIMTATNDTAVDSSTAIGWPFSNDVFGDVCTISLTPGEWELSAMLTTNNSGGTVATTSIELGISTTSGNSTAGLVPGSNFARQTPTKASGDYLNLTIASHQVSVTSQTTYYLKGRAGTSTTSLGLDGARISGRRIR